MKKMKYKLINTNSFQEIVQKESNKFCIEAYNDFISIDGTHVFDKLEAKEIFKQLLASMEETYKTAKNDLEKDQAKEALETLRLVPYKVH